MNGDLRDDCQKAHEWALREIEEWGIVWVEDERPEVERDLYGMQDRSN